jgi:hypothetical protein
MRRLLLALLVALAPASLAGQAPDAPRLVNGTIDVRAGARDIAAAVRSLPAGPADVAWIGWAVASADRHQRCCGHEYGDGPNCCDACRLEKDPVLAASSVPAPPGPGNTRPIQLEPSGRVVVLARVVVGAVERVRVYSDGCTLDAMGRTVTWLPAVTPEASVAWLDGLVASASRRPADDALMALAAHAAPQAVDRLIAHARSGATPRLRGQALFWLAQRAGDRAVGAITEAIDRDPDTDVKKKAVFALSQLPKDEGVPRLIDVARAHSNPAVRKQAFFWLGQSKDPRAIAFFADVLKR